jgi:hypothetical protein
MFNLSGSETGSYPELGNIMVPVLAIVGTVEEYFIGTPGHYLDGMSKALKNAPDFAGRVVTGAPHNYLEYESLVAELIREWLGRRRGV